jgi:hypothetical protein
MNKRKNKKKDEAGDWRVAVPGGTRQLSEGGSWDELLVKQTGFRFHTCDSMLGFGTLYLSPKSLKRKQKYPTREGCSETYKCSYDENASHTASNQ